MRPVLVTVDSHDDVGADSDVMIEDLDNLNLKDDVHLGIFSWLRLRRLNDGHILPALYLDFFSDVYVLMNDPEGDFGSRSFVDKNGVEHNIYYFEAEQDLLDALPDDEKVYFDIDLDYFSSENPKTGNVHGSQIQCSDKDIKKFFCNPKGLFKTLQPLFVGMTIALEPKYCGGYANCMNAFNILNQEVFNNTLNTENSKWKM